jgi:serine/threonine-protein kinase
MLPGTPVVVAQMQSLNELIPGRFLGRYELLMPVAQGGMASVWAARLQGTRGFQKVVAIKTILPTLSDDPRFEQMFLDEAGLASRIRHSNVAQVLDLGEDQGVLYQVMEWIEGPPLNQLVREATGGNGLPRPIAAKIMSGVCEGLHAAHEMRDDTGKLVGLVHRDVSPQNILVSIDGVPKVVDFGVAKATSLSTARTATGTFKGKPAYMAPEQILGGEVDRRADIFALGVVLYLITTGRHPFRGDTEMATLHRVVDPKPPARPSDLLPGYPTGLEFVVMKAIAKQMDSRFETAADMARALHQAVAEVHDLGDTDVAACVRELSGASIRKRGDALKNALAAADARGPASGRASGVPRSSHASEPPQIEIVAIQEVPTKTAGLTPSDGTPYSTASSAAPATVRSKLLPAVLGAVAALAIGALVIVLVARGKPQPFQVSEVVAPPSATATAEPSASADPSAAPAAPETPDAAPLSSSPAIAADSLPRVPTDIDTPRPAPARRDAGTGGDGPIRTPSKGYVPSVRDPGF